MYTTVNENEFIDIFGDCNRSDNFSLAGRVALFNYLEELEEDMGEIELDVIALCCEYTEYADLAKFQEDYGKDEYKSMGDIRKVTTVIMIDDISFIIRQF